MDNLTRMLQAIRDFTPEQMASFGVFDICEKFDKSFVRNGGLILGRLLQLQGNYLAAVQRHGDKAKFRLALHADSSVRRALGILLCRVEIFAAFYMKKKPGANPHKLTAYIIQMMCEELAMKINEKVNKRLR
jgi:hypothetical protein